MTSSARADIFSKLRKAGAGLSGERIARELEDIGNAAVTAPPESELCEAFIIKVLGNGGSADCAGNRPDAVKTVAKYLSENFRSLRLVAGSDARLAAMPWRDGGVLPRFGCVTEGEREHGHFITYDLYSLERDARKTNLDIIAKC